MRPYNPALPVSDPARKLAVLLNPSSAGGRALRALPEAERCFRDLNLPYRIVQTQSIEHAAESAREATAQGEIVVSMGGDGLVGALAGVLRGGDGVLGILPGGRGNDFARSLGIPKGLDQACGVLATGEVKKFDLGDANGRTFAGIAATGFDAVANELANRVKLIKGNLVYAYAGLRVLATWKSANFRIVADGVEQRLTGFSVAVANSKAHGGGIYVAPGADLADGQFDVVTVGDIGKLRALATLPKLFKGTHLASPAVNVFRAREVEISADRPFAVYADGDRIAELPVTITAVPAALRVIVPRATEGL